MWGRRRSCTQRAVRVFPRDSKRNRGYQGDSVRQGRHAVGFPCHLDARLSKRGGDRESRRRPTGARRSTTGHGRIRSSERAVQARAGAGMRHQCRYCPPVGGGVRPRRCNAAGDADGGNICPRSGCPGGAGGRSGVFVRTVDRARIASRYCHHGQRGAGPRHHVAFSDRRFSQFRLRL